MIDERPAPPDGDQPAILAVLPADIDAAAFHNRHNYPGRWRGAISYV